MGIARRWCAALAVVGVVLSATVTGMAPGGAAPPIVRQYDDTLRADGSVTYSVDLEARTIHVRAEVTLENLAAPARSSTGVRRFFYTDFAFAVPSGATDVRATMVPESTAQTVTVTAVDDFYGIARIRLSPRLDHGTPRSYVIDYDIVDDGIRSETTTRVNAAFASFDLIPIGGPGRADITVEVPDGLTATFVGEQLDTRGDNRFGVTDIADPQSWFGSLSIRDDAALLSRTVTLDDGPVVISAWPGDQTWSDFVSDTVERGLPSIEAIIGIARPDAEALTIIESASPYLYGYAGWYLPDDDRIEVGDQLDRQVVLHELTHIWFNEELFDSRWINEGLAEVVSNRVVAELGGTAAAPEAIGTGQRGAQPLNDWAQPLATEANTGDEETYGYQTSHLVMDRLLGALGPDDVRAVLAAASGREIAYRAPGDAESLDATPDWRGLLDYLEELGGVDDATAVFAEYVVAAGERELLDDRTAMRGTYHDFIATSGGWAAPFPVREAMATWSFARVPDGIDDARTLLVRRDALAVLVAPLEASVPDALRVSYERDDAATAAETFDRFDQAAEALARADGRVDDGRGPLAVIGLLGADPSDRLDRAVVAFDDGDAGSATARADAVVASLDGATRAGALRLGAGAALGGVGASVVAARRRRVRDEEMPLALES